MSKHFLIIGTGIAGLTAAETIRKELPDAEITMVGRESELPYLRPLLSKTSLRTIYKENLQIHPLDWYEKQNIRLLTGTTCTEILRKEHKAMLSGGETLPYDKLIYAAGAAPFMPPYADVPQGIFTLRSIRDLQQIRRYAATSTDIVVIGGGVIGLEMAWELKQTGAEVTVLEMAPRLMGRQLDEESSDEVIRICESQGIRVYTGAMVDGFRRGADGKRVEAVVMKDGSVFAAQTVILSVGVRANKALAEAAGLACGRGVIVNVFMQTEDPDIYAAGDCIEWPGINPALWTFSMESAKAAAYNACHPLAQQELIAPASDVLVHTMGTALFSTGIIGEEGSEEVRITESGESLFRVNFFHGVRPGGKFEKRFYKEGKLRGAILIGDLTPMREIKEAFRMQRGGNVK